MIIKKIYRYSWQGHGGLDENLENAKKSLILLLSSRTLGAIGAK